MASRGWDVIPVLARMPAVNETVNGAEYVVPAHSQCVSFHVPTLVSSATVKLQALDLQGAQLPSTEVWRDVKVFNLAAGGVQALAAIPNNTVVTIPTAATGAGVFRLVASSDQSSSPVFISILISRL